MKTRRDSWGKEVMFWSFKNQHYFILKLLLPMLKKDSVNEKDNNGNTPLHLATIKRRKNIVAPLVRKGADVNARNNGGNTPLHLATIKEHDDIAELLLEFGADVSATNCRGETPMDLANRYEIRHMIQLLEEAALQKKNQP